MKQATRERARLKGKVRRLRQIARAYTNVAIDIEDEAYKKWLLGLVDLTREISAEVEHLIDTGDLSGASQLSQRRGAEFLESIRNFAPDSVVKARA